MADPGGGATGARPLKFGRLIFFSLDPFCIRMLKNRAKIARESIKTPRASRAPGPLPKEIRVSRS